MVTNTSTVITPAKAASAAVRHSRCTAGRKITLGRLQISDALMGSRIRWDRQKFSSIATVWARDAAETMAPMAELLSP